MSNGNIHIAMSVVSSYIYRSYGDEILITYLINRDEDFNPVCVRIFLSEKDSEFPINYDKAYLVRNDLLSEGQCKHIFEYYGLDNIDFIIRIIQTKEEMEEIPDALNAEYNKHEALFKEYGEESRKAIFNILNTIWNFNDSNRISISYQFDWDEISKILVLTVIYKVLCPINSNIRKLLTTQISDYGEYLAEPSQFLRNISPSIVMRNDITYIDSVDTN